MGARRRAREHALMMLFGMDVAGRWPDAAIEHFYDQFATGEPLDPPPSYEEEPTERDLYAVAVGDDESREYSEALVRGVSLNQEEIDALLQKISVHWRLERMALVDRNLLRLAAFELTKLAEDVPRNVAINEAIELAKVFGTAESGAFVNGILDRIGK